MEPEVRGSPIEFRRCVPSQIPNDQTDLASLVELEAPQALAADERPASIAHHGAHVQASVQLRVFRADHQVRFSRFERLAPVPSVSINRRASRTTVRFRVITPRLRIRRISRRV
jgi:hypothetical protein